MNTHEVGAHAHVEYNFYLGFYVDVKNFENSYFYQIKLKSLKKLLHQKDTNLVKPIISILKYTPTLEFELLTNPKQYQYICI